MELIAVLVVLFFAWVLLKIFAGLFHVAFFAIALPFKLLAVGLASLIVILVLIPLGLVGAIVGLAVAPLVILAPLLPIVLVVWGIILVARNSR